MRILEWVPVVKPPVAETRVEVVVDEREVAVVRQQKGKRRRVRGSDQKGALATLRFTLFFSLSWSCAKVHGKRLVGRGG